MKFTGLITRPFVLCLVLAACATETDYSDIHAKLNKSAPLQSLGANRKIDPAIIATLDLLNKKDYRAASKLANLKLQDQPANVAMHILNAVAYEGMAEAGDSGRLDLAIIGYESALNVDPSNILAIRRLGQLRFKKREFDKAQELFANALLIRPEDPVLLQELAAASYYAFDLKTAQAAIEKAVVEMPDDLLAQRSATMIYAALGQFDTSKEHFEKYKALAGEDPDVQMVSKRMNDWEGLYGSGRIHLAQNSDFSAFKGPYSDETSDSDGDGDGGGSDDSATADIPIQSLAQQALHDPRDATKSTSSNGDDSQGSKKGTKTTSESPPKDLNKLTKQQVIIDCYLLRIDEVSGTSKGDNILRNLQVTLTPGAFLAARGKLTGSGTSTKSQVAAAGGEPGSNAQDTPGFAANTTSIGVPAPSFNFTNSGQMNLTNFYGGLTWSGLSYNLNIANVTDNRTEVIARPSLLTLLNKESVFFSGTELVVGLVGDDGGTLVKYPVGVTLVVTPTEIDERTGMVTLTISIEGAEFNTPVQDLTATVSVGKTRIDTSAKVKLGDTLALGGIYERVEVFNKEGVPGLSDTPILQYIFSREVSSTERRSVVILMTPRSPEKVRRDVEHAMAENRETPNVDELEKRHKDWFNTAPNLVKIFSHLTIDPIIYGEFRSLDVLPPSWGEPDNFVEDPWAMLASFLYY